MVSWRAPAALSAGRCCLLTPPGTGARSTRPPSLLRFAVRPEAVAAMAQSAAREAQLSLKWRVLRLGMNDACRTGRPMSARLKGTGVGCNLR